MKQFRKRFSGFLMEREAEENWMLSLQDLPALTGQRCDPHLERLSGVFYFFCWFAIIECTRTLVSIRYYALLCFPLIGQMYCFAFRCTNVVFDKQDGVRCPPHFEPVHQMKRAYRRKNDGELHRFAQKADGESQYGRGLHAAGSGKHQC